MSKPWSFETSYFDIPLTVTYLPEDGDVTEVTVLAGGVDITDLISNRHMQTLIGEADRDLQQVMADIQEAA